MDYDVTRAYGLGWNAFLAGDQHWHNPFDMDDDLIEWQDWRRGWEESRLTFELEN